MCGIAGAAGVAVREPGRLEQALVALRRRGPDAEGIHHGSIAATPVTLLHTRLSIIDLDPRANQPLTRGRCTIVHNGEIYNYVEVRSELEASGVSFTTGSDTEVALEAYRAWGSDYASRLEGMFAHGIIDEPRSRLILTRDRFGEKPLHLMRHKGNLYFASNVAALAALSGRRPDIDEDQIRRYLVNGYKSLNKARAGWYLDVEEVPPATVIEVTPSLDSSERRYWDLRYSPTPMSAEEALEGSRELLVESVALRMRSDVPVAFCLSGGVDSNALAGIAAGELGRDVHTFSIIDDDPRYDESKNIAATVASLESQHHEFRTGRLGFFERLSDLVIDRRAPVVTLSAYIHSFLAEGIADAGFKVALSGLAADELYTGYYDHYGFWLAEMADDPDADQLVADWRASYGAVVRNPYLQNPLTFRDSPGERGHIYLNADRFAAFLTEPFDEPFTESRYSETTLRQRTLNEVWHESVPVLLREDDSNAMRYSIENRSPFLDSRLAEFLYRVPVRHLIRDGRPKTLLREGIAGLVPDSVRLDTTKRGFNVSIESLVDRGDPGTRGRLLADSPVYDLVRRDRIESLLDGDDSRLNSYSKFLFSFISVQTFLENHAEWSP